MQGSNSSSARVPVARRSHRKSKTGCQTCRNRKVKCDERRPLCRNCEKHFIGLISCDFDDQAPVLAQDAPAGTNQVGRAAEPLQLPTMVSASSYDALLRRPQSEVPSTTFDKLAAYYLNSFAYRSFPFYASKDLIDVWWPFVQADDLLFHVVMLLSSIDLARTSNITDTTSEAQLFGQSVSILRSRLAEPTASNSISDATIAAVALLAALEHHRDNIRALQMHISALKHIVDQRGGLSAVKAENPMVANVLFWCALVAINEPALLPLTYEDALEMIDQPQDADDASLLTHDGGEANLFDLGLDPQTAFVLHDVQRLSRLYTATLSYGSPDEAMDVLSQLCIILQRLLTLSKLSDDVTGTPGLSQSCRLAGVLHVFTPLSGYFPDPTMMLHALVRDIKSSLTKMIGATGTHSHLLLWLLGVAGITAHSMPERAWFVGHLVVVVQDLEIKSWQVFRSNLVKLAFHDNFCDVSFQALWDEVRQKQDALDVYS
ncbi:hypothetical protein M409DRAFT_30705 [Zasmidium cellare ATCC 36951]|uniref:Zn(2)-C6 fungal-type domain-containing protein n=1 Tax=Zasmidium cellare ATCC 36951 TaxID=1080233 RepID=A0A6A6BW75_ZASCE|nr:uncharacterized protein M409DRAFT_30705 [Zasmidium cellare ATCC 36951]KAF2158833.1 hypothetical protein M409DRAFT_30705 [Zasmidium cellare ATCC 36951]